MTTPVPAQPRAHVLLVSTAFQSHVNPLMRLGRRLAAKGVLVTFTTALRKGIRLDEVPGGIDDDDALSRFGVERLRGDALWEPEDPRFGVPGDMARHVAAAGPAALEALIRREAQAGRPVTCVVANAFVPWALRVAGELGLPRAMLWIQSCALLSVYYHYVHSLAAFPEAGEDASGSLAIPGLPELGIDDLRPLLIYNTPVHDMWRQMLVADLRSVRDKGVSWLFVNTFDELEHEAIAALSEHAPVIPVGPLIEPDEEPLHGNKGNDDDGSDGIAAWLDAQAPRSVVFVAFGSIVNTGDDETAEIAGALAGTGRPFLWVLRDESRALLSRDTLDNIRAPGGGKGDSLSLGKVVPWCRQTHVLAHGAVGCFVTHCGWNSTAEALAAGVPMVACPRWSDQRINAKFVVDVYRVGVRGPSPVTRDALRVAVEEVMSGPEGEAMGARAAGWKERSRAAVADGGSSDLGVQAFVDQIC